MNSFGKNNCIMYLWDPTYACIFRILPTHKSGKQLQIALRKYKLGA